MKIRGLMHYGALGVALLTLALITPLRGQVIWNGQTNPAAVNVSANWVDETPPNFEGADSATFSDITAEFPTQTVQFPNSFGLYDLTFGGESRPEYTFVGIDNPTLTLVGDVTVGYGADVTFASSLNLRLSDYDHTIDIAEGVTFTVASQIGQTGSEGGSSLNKDGAGILVLSGANTFTGDEGDPSFTLGGGTLRIGSSSTGEEVLIEGEVPYYEFVIQNGPVGMGGLSLAGGTTLGAIGAQTLHNNINLSESEGAVTLDTSTGDLILLGSVYGPGADGFTKTGAGTLTLGASSYFDGGVTVEAGTLLLAASSEQEYEEDTYGPVGNGTLILMNGTTLGVAPDAASIVLHNTIDLPEAGGTNVTAATGPNSLTLHGTINGNASLTKTGTGSLTLGTSDGNGGFGAYSSSTFQGFIVQEGGLFLGSSSQNSEGLSGPVGAGTLTLKNGTTLGTVADNTNISLHNAISLDTSAGTAYVTIGGSYRQLNLLGNISGAAGLTKGGAGLLVLSGSNSFQGGLTISDGIVQINSNTGTGQGVLKFSGESGTANFNAGAPAIYGLEGGAGTFVNLLSETTNLTINQAGNSTFAGTITGTYGSVFKRGAGTLTLAGANTYGGSTTVNGGQLSLAASGVLPSGQNLVVNSTTAGQTAQLNLGAGFTQTVGHLTFGGAGGTSTSTSVASLGTGSTLTLAPGSNVNLNATGNPLGATLGGGTLALGATTTFNIGDSTSAAYDLTVSSVITGTGYGVNKTGAGTLVFNGANTYTGDTTITAGKLVAGNNNALGGGAVTLNGGALGLAPGITLANTINFGGSGGALAGNWTFTTPQTFGAGIKLSPGNSPGTMTFAAGYAPGNGVSTTFEISAATDVPGSSADLIAVTGGTLDLSALSAGGYTLQLISLLPDNVTPGAVSGLSGPASWTLFQSVALTGFDAADFTIDSSQFFGGGVFSLTQSTNNLVLNFTPVPEPSTYALMLMGLGFSGLAAWRQRRRA